MIVIKRHLLVGLVPTVVLALVACGGGAENVEETVTVPARAATGRNSRSAAAATSERCSRHRGLRFGRFSSVPNERQRLGNRPDVMRCVG